MKEKKFLVSEEDLKTFWENSWNLSKGYEKSEHQSDIKYKEEQFQIYFNKFMENQNERKSN